MSMCATIRAAGPAAEPMAGGRKCPKHALVIIFKLKTFVAKTLDQVGHQGTALVPSVTVRRWC
jgi:hypothetical protein